MTDSLISTAPIWKPLTLMAIAEDKEFLLEQREKGRCAPMAGLNTKLKEGVSQRERGTNCNHSPALEASARV